jgi:hypothetical protein
VGEAAPRLGAHGRAHEAKEEGQLEHAHSALRGFTASLGHRSRGEFSPKQMLQPSGSERAKCPGQGGWSTSRHACSSVRSAVARPSTAPLARCPPPIFPRAALLRALLQRAPRGLIADVAALQADRGPTARRGGRRPGARGYNRDKYGERRIGGGGQFLASSPTAVSPTPHERYTLSMYWSIVTLTSIGYGDIVA